ncbi:hypothetical protein ES702_05410 [subsurface metagenome]
MRVRTSVRDVKCKLYISWSDLVQRLKFSGGWYYDEASKTPGLLEGFRRSEYGWFCKRMERAKLHCIRYESIGK